MVIWKILIYDGLVKKKNEFKNQMKLSVNMKMIIASFFS